MKSTFRILFFVKGKCVKRSGKVPIQVRLTIDGDPVQFSIKQDIDPKIWDPKNGKAMGRSPEAVKVDNLLVTVAGTLKKKFDDLTRYDEPTTAAQVRDAFLGIDIKNDTLLKIFAAFNQRRDARMHLRDDAHPTDRDQQYDGLRAGSEHRDDQRQGPDGQYQTVRPVQDETHDKRVCSLCSRADSMDGIRRLGADHGWESAFEDILDDVWRRRYDQVQRLGTKEEQQGGYQPFIASDYRPASRCNRGNTFLRGVREEKGTNGTKNY